MVTLRVGLRELIRVRNHWGVANKRIRVLTMVEGMGYAAGGAERLAVGIASSLDPERFHSSLCVTRWDEAAADRDDIVRAVGDLEKQGFGS